MTNRVPNRSRPSIAELTRCPVLGDECASNRILKLVREHESDPARIFPSSSFLHTSSEYDRILFIWIHRGMKVIFVFTIFF